MVDIRTTITGFELTLQTLGEISNLLNGLDKKLEELNPELPRLSTYSGNSGTMASSLATMLEAYQAAFATMVMQSAQLLGTSAAAPVVLTLEQPAAAQVAPAPVAPAPVAPAPVAPAATAPTVAAPAVAPAAAAAPEVAPAAPVAQAQAQVAPAAPKANTPAPAGDFKPVDSVASGRHGSTAPALKQLKDAAEIIKPLKPIEMASAENPIGPMTTNGLTIIYAHGTEIKRHWPATRDAKAAIETPIPNEAWRLLVFEGNVFCVGEEKVTVLSTGELHKEGTFQGKFVNQTHTTTSWAGLQLVDGAINFMTRDRTGRTAGESINLGTPGDAPTFMASSGDTVFAAFGTGELFRMEAGAANALPTYNKHGAIIGMAVDARGLVVTSQSAQGIIISILDANGGVRAESKPVAGSISHPIALTHDRLFLFDDVKAQLVAVSLDGLAEVQRLAIEGVTGVARMIAIQEDAGAMVAILSKDAEGRPIDVHLTQMESGNVTKLCHISATRGELVYTEGHFGIASTTSLQNMIQVFNCYGPVRAAKAA